MCHADLHALALRGLDEVLPAHFQELTPELGLCVRAGADRSGQTWCALLTCVRWAVPGLSEVLLRSVAAIGANPVSQGWGSRRCPCISTETRAILSPVCCHCHGAGCMHLHSTQCSRALS